MSSSANQTKIQVRLGKCILKSISVPLQCSVALRKDRNVSTSSPWKRPTDGVITFNSFLRIKADECQEKDKCNLLLHSRSGDGQKLLGEALLSLSQENCGKVRKYPIKRGGQVVATIQVSFYLFFFDYSIPLLEKNMNQISHQFYYSANQNEVSLEQMLMSQQENVKKVKNQQNCLVNKLSIERQLSLTVNQENQKLNVGQNLMVKLFQEIKRKNDQIQMRNAELHEKDSLFQHIKVKQMHIQKESKKISRLKSEARLLIAANEELIHHDDKYDAEFYAMKEQKQQMQSQMAIMNSQASLKLACLKAQLQSTNRQLNKKQTKIKMMIDQIQNSVKTLNNLKHENKEKTKIIDHLKSSLNHHPTRIQKSTPKKQEGVNIFDMITQQIGSRKLSTEGNIETLPSDLLQFNRQNSFALKRCKTLSIARPQNNKQEKPHSKQRFRANKNDSLENKVQIPGIIQYIMNLGSSIQCKI